MNKNCYRIIFNRQKGQLTVVSELANRNGCVATASSTPKTTSQSVIAKLKPLCLMVGMALGSVIVVEPAMAEIIADNTAAEHQQPQIIQHGDKNQQIVNIQAPTKGGLSHNKYTQFDVDKNGVILNNSNRSTNTKLGGRIDGNANLANGQAKIILNEVNSHNPSQLNGFIEVAGQKAQVIIANPSGIACDGCGFINADKATLTTGKPQIEEGQLKGYSVTQGTISINGKEFDSRKQDYTEIIARSVELNTVIRGNDIKVVTGRNEVSADLNTVTAYDDINDDKPRVALDVSALGGMYAGKIHLVGTENGVGVNNAGRLSASKDSIVLNANGKIVNTGVIQAKEDILVKSTQDIENTKQINSKKNVKLISNEQIVNEGSLVAQQGDIKAKAKKVVLRGKNSAGQQIKVKADTLADLSNSNTQAKSLAVSSGETIDINSAVLYVDEDIKLASEASINSNNVDVNTTNYIAQSKNIDNKGATIIADKDILLAASETLNNEFASLQAGAALTLTGSIVNNDQANLEAENDILVTSKILTAKNASLTSGNNIKIDTDEKFDAENIKIDAKGEVNIASKANINAKNANITTDKTLAIQANQLELTGADIDAYDAINVNASLINNDAATWRSKGNIAVSADDINNSGSSISSDQSITLNANNTINNSESEIFSQDFLNVNAKNVDNRFANIASNSDITLQAEDSINNTKAEISAAALTLDGTTIINQEAVLNALSGGMAIKSSNIDNNEAILSSKEKMEILGNTINNTKSKITAAALTLEADDIINKEAELTTLGGENYDGSMTITGNQLDNSKATLTSAGNMTVVSDHLRNDGPDTDDNLNNSEATLNSKGKMLIKGRDINNTKAKISAAELYLNGTIILNQEAKLTTLGGEGYQGLMTIDSMDLNNSEAILNSKGNMLISSNNINNTKAEISSANDLEIVAHDNMNNQEAKLTTLGGEGHQALMTLSGFRIDNSKATLTSADNMIINGYDILNSEATLTSQGRMNLNGSGEINNTKAEITAGDLTMQASIINNQEAKLTTLGSERYEGSMSISGFRINNSKATLTSAADMDILAYGILCREDLCRTDQHDDLPSYIDYIDNSEAILTSKGVMRLKTSSIDSHIYNTNAEISAAVLEIKSDNIHNQEAKLTSFGGEGYQGTMIITGKQLDNSKATLTSAGDMSIETNHSDDNNPGEGSNEEDPIVIGGSDVTAPDDNLNNSEAILTSKGKMLINSNNMNNTKAKISAAELTLSGNTISNQEAELTTLVGEGEEKYQGNMTITSKQLDNSKAALTSAGDITITSDELNNSEAILTSQGKIQITSGSIDNTKAEISAATLTLEADDIINQEAVLNALSGGMAIKSTNIDNNEATLSSKDKMEILGNTINNTKSKITAAALTLEADDIINKEAELTTLGGENNDGFMTIIGNQLDNSKATLTSAGNMTVVSDHHRIDGTEADDNINNSGATLNSKGKMLINGRDINNTKAKISAADLDLYGTTVLNQEAVISASSGNMAITSDNLNNNEATLSSKGHTLINGTNINNTKSKITAGYLTINANTIINQEAVLTTLGGESHEGTMTIKGNHLDNSKATLTSADNMVITTDQVDNIPDELNNSEATLISQGTMEINSNYINNEKAKISANDLKLVANTLLNNEAVLNALSSEGGITIDSNKVDNSNATLTSAGNMTVRSNQVDNNQATLISNGDILIDGDYIDNMKAKISAIKDLILKAKTIRNQEATLTANRIDITATDYLDNQQATLVGKEGISINTDEFDNIQAKITTDGKLDITAGDINNNQSLLRAGQIEINANKLENQNADISANSVTKINADEITNTNTQIYAEDLIDITGNVLTNDGHLFANNISINLQDELDNTKEIFAKNQLSIKAKQVSNEGDLVSVNTLTLNSDLAKNATIGVIDSQDIKIEGGSLSNNGLINGDNIDVKLSGQFDNNDSARVYGDSINIVANELNNKASSMAVENAPIIAAKQFLHIDANTLNNYNHALLLSQDNMFIKATTLNNHSARIESYTDMDIMVDTLNNINDSITTQEVKVKDQRVHEYAPIASSQRYNAEDVSKVISPEKNHRNYILKSKTGAFKDAERFNEYNYNVTSYETQITNTAPAEIVSGNNLYVNAAQVNNTSSSILAGNEVSMDEKILNNVSTQGISRQETKGKMTYHFPIRKGINGFVKGAETSDIENTQESKFDFNNAKVENNASFEKTEVAFVPHWSNQIER